MDETLQPAALELSDASRDFLAGGVSGMVGVASSQPLDTLRVRQQSAAPGTAAPSLLTLAREVAGREGTRALFKGMAGPVATAALQNAILFQTYGAASRALEGAVGGGGGDLGPASAAFAAGCASGAVQAVLVTPVDLIKIRMQVQRACRGDPGYVGVIGMVRGIATAEGALRGLARGLGPTLFREVPSYGAYFAIFTVVRDRIIQRLLRSEAVGGRGEDEEVTARGGGDEVATRGDHDDNEVAMVLRAGPPATPRIEPADLAPTPSHAISGAATCVAGGVAGMLSWLAVYPIDVVKTRIQATSADASRYAGMRDCFRKSWREEGAAAFTRGLSATLWRAALVNAVIFSVYEGVHSRLA